MSTRIGSGRPRRPGASQGRHRPQHGHGPGRSDHQQGNGRNVLPTPKRREPTLVELPQTMTVKELADSLNVAGGLIIKDLISRGFMVTINQTIDFATASEVATTFGAQVKQKQIDASEGVIAAEIEEEEHLRARPPIVTILGHVDHGKTSLLDAIRQTNVTAQEHGGITQHIGAYQVEAKGRKITFLDTPGHAAFTAMRARGAQVTDIAILVVAADDGVQPQTVEAINHARAADVPLVVAINKIDRAEANPDRVKQQLAENSVLVTDWGGEVEVVGVSAKAGTGISDLLETVLLVADIQDLKANPSRQATGTVIEAQLDKARGPVATVLVQNGTLEVGDMVAVGSTHGKIRAMTNDRGKRLKKAEPAMPVEILGLNGVPQAGDRLVVAPNEQAARSYSQQLAAQRAEENVQVARPMTLEEMFKQDNGVKDLNVVIKADVQGSVEPIQTSLERLSNEEVQVKVIHKGTGNVTESDVLLAQASGGIIVGFNVGVEPGAKRAAESANVDIRLYRIIYDLVEDVRKALVGMLEPKFVELQEGRAEVRVIFGKTNQVAGSMVLEGRITRGAKARVLRGGKEVAEGTIDSLRRFKDDVREVAAGFECGIGVSGVSGLQEGDVIATFRTERVAGDIPA
ncbi:MAG TPA: translation initiation factor IF-2 [Chloroflexota bacterium]|nr:translation initiation factor IF-2 [Chloroflexota bacterium]